MSAKENNIKDTQLCVNTLRRPRNLRQALLLFALLLGFGFLANSCEDTSEASLTACPENLTAPVLNATEISRTSPDFIIGWTLPNVSCDYTLEIYLKDMAGITNLATVNEIINQFDYKYTYPKGTTQAAMQTSDNTKAYYFPGTSSSVDVVIVIRDSTNSSNTAISSAKRYTAPN